MIKRIVFTKLELDGTEMLLCGLMADGHLIDARLYDASCCHLRTKPNVFGSILENIYIGKVQKTVKNLNAVFVEIAPNLPCYLSLDHVDDPVFVKSSCPGRIMPGDEILVQVQKDAARGKAPVLSTNLNFTGRYAVLTTGNHKLGISSKLDCRLREHYRQFFSDIVPADCGLIIRTNARNAPDREIRSEISLLTERMRQVLSHSANHRCYSCLYHPQEVYLSYLRGAYLEDLDEIITDLPELYDELSSYCKNYSDLSAIPLTLYEDEEFPLVSLLNLRRELLRATSREVRLHSGGFLVFDRTEAMTVVDVNSGKNTSAKDREENSFSINREASQEIARQIRLRNLSGIILIDYIDLDSKEDQRALLEDLRLLVKSDPIPVQVHDITALNLVEVTRKRVEKSLFEQIKQLTIKNPL